MLEHALDAFRRGELARAESLLHKLWQHQPDSAVAALQGQVLRGSCRWPDAIAWFEKALAADPVDARPLLAIGQIHRQQGDLEAARACFEQVVLQSAMAQALGGENPLRLFELGLAYAELEQPEDAIAALEAAFGADQTLLETDQLLTLTRLLQQQGRISDAASYHAALLQRQPSSLSARMNLALCHHQGGEDERWLAFLEALLGEFPGDTRISEVFLFLASTAGAGWLEQRQQVATAHWQSFAAGRSGVGPARELAKPSGPLRVGILTAELGNHPVSYFLESFLRHHDRARLEVDLLETQPRWESRNRLLCGLAHSSLQLPEHDAAMRHRLIRERRYQVILETSGFTTGSGLSLLAERLAPVQCHYVGFHASTFLPTIDWFIADAALLPPELEGQFSERIWRLPRPWAAYTPPHQLPPPLSPAPEAAPMFGSCNQIAKVGNATLCHWAAALRAVPQAQLLVKHRNTADPQVRERITAALEKAGVTPERVHFEGWAPDWAAHMATYNRIDVALDTTPWSSATTAFEALAMVRRWWRSAAAPWRGG